MAVLKRVPKPPLQSGILAVGVVSVSVLADHFSALSSGQVARFIQFTFAGRPF